jgi:hypothetical protein
MDIHSNSPLSFRMIKNYNFFGQTGFKKNFEEDLSIGFILIFYRLFFGATPFGQHVILSTIKN